MFYQKIINENNFTNIYINENPIINILLKSYPKIIFDRDSLARAISVILFQFINIGLIQYNKRSISTFLMN